MTVPKQRNTREENDRLKQGQVPSEWSLEKRAHKDCDARWTRKGPDTFFGYKNHVKVDRTSKLTEEQRRTNRWHARTRVRVEHVFAVIKNCIHGEHLRYIGQKRIAAAVAMTNPLHNVLRVGQLRAQMG